MKHLCHAHGCDRPCPSAMLMCPRHWRLVPPEVRLEIYISQPLRGPRVDETWSRWVKAKAEAIYAVALEEFGEKIDQLAAKHHYQRDLELAQRLQGSGG